MNRLTMMRKRHTAILAEADTLISAASAANRDMTPAESRSFERLLADADTLKARITEIQTAVDKESESRRFADWIQPAGFDAFADGPHEPVGYRSAFLSYARRGLDGVTRDQRELLDESYKDLGEVRALGGTISGAAGGFLVPFDFVSRIKDSMKAFGGLRNAGVEVLTTGTGSDLRYPGGDDTINTGRLLAEHGEAADDVDPAFGSTTLKAFIWTSELIRVSNTLLVDEGVDLESYLATKLGQRIGRAQAPYLISGTGEDEPEGITTNAIVGHAAVGDDDGPISYSDLVEQEASIDSAYLPGAEWVISKSLAKALRGMVDGNGRPMLTGADAGLAGFGPSRELLGYPVTIDQGLGSVAEAGATVGIFGDLSGYTIRDVSAIHFHRLSERYAEFNETGFVIFTRMDARPTDLLAYRAFTIASGGGS